MLKLHRSATQICVLTIGLLLLISPTLVSAKQVSQDEVLHFGTSGRDISTLDPHFATTATTYPIVKAMFDGLVRFPAGSINLEEIQPDLARAWEVSDDGEVWTFHLRQGVKWHKGYGELTAEDVKFSLDRVRDKQVGSPWRSTYANYESVKVLDKYTVQITLEQANPFFLLTVISDHGGLIVCKEAVEELGEDFKLNPVGTGPFALEDYKTRQSVILEANDDYFGGEPYLSGLVFRFMPELSSRELAVRKGELDAAVGKMDQVWVEQQRKRGLKIDVWESPGNATHLHFNMTVEPLDKLKVRKALAYAIDRKALVEYAGEDIAPPYYSPVPPGYFGHIDMPEDLKYHHDLGKAKKLLEEAGYGDGFSLTMKCSESSLYLPFVKIIQEQWSKIGVKLNIEVVDHSTYHSLIREDANPIVLYAAGRRPIADVYLTQWYHSDSIVTKSTGVTNFSHYGEVDADGDGEVDSIDDLIEEARFELNPEKQKDLYAQAQKQLMEHMAAYQILVRGWVLVRQPYVRLASGFIQKDGGFNNLYEGYIFDENTRILEH